MAKIHEVDPINKEEWEKRIGLNEFKIININDLPSALAENGLVKKFSGMVLCSSGSADYAFYSVMGARTDSKNAIDKDGFVYAYNRMTGSGSGVQILHANFLDRTITLPDNIYNTMKASGSAFVPPNLIGFPSSESGSLSDLMNDKNCYDATKYYLNKMDQELDKRSNVAQ